MDRKKICHIFCRYLIAIGIMAALFVTTAIADQEAPGRSYKIVTDNGKYVFVMHPQKGAFSDGTDTTLLKEYPRSGLYINDRSRRLLWTVDWYARTVYLSSDGTHLIRMGDWPRGSAVETDASERDSDELLMKAYRKESLGPKANRQALSQLAIAFYERGVLVREYAIADIVKRPEQLPESVSHFQWVEEAAYDDSKGEISIRTYDGQRMVFDKKGALVSRSE